MSLRGFPGFVLCVLVIAFSGGCGGGSSETPVSEAFRSVAAVSALDGRYARIESQVVNSEAELERLIAGTDGNDGLGPIAEPDPLVVSLRASRINFDQEALVVLRETSGGGSSRISLDPPQLQGRTFVSTLRTTQSSSGGGGAAISHHFFVFAVSRARVDDVRVAVVPVRFDTGAPATIRLTVPD